jgi:hypothetical protein
MKNKIKTRDTKFNIHEEGFFQFLYKPVFILFFMSFLLDFLLYQKIYKFSLEPLQLDHS